MTEGVTDGIGWYSTILGVLLYAFEYHFGLKRKEVRVLGVNHLPSSLPSFLILVPFLSLQLATYKG